MAVAVAVVSAVAAAAVVVFAVDQGPGGVHAPHARSGWQCRQHLRKAHGGAPKLPKKQSVISKQIYRELKLEA